MRIDLFMEGIALPYGNVTVSWFKRTAGKICRALLLEKASLTLILTDDASIKRINGKYRKKNRPTDVISFAYREEPFPAVDVRTENIGDIYISLETAIAQSMEYSVCLRDELTRLVIHGVLHLIGYDHEKSPKDEEKMRRMEDTIIRHITVKHGKKK